MPHRYLSAKRAHKVTQRTLSEKITTNVIIDGIAFVILEQARRGETSMSTCIHYSKTLRPYLNLDKLRLHFEKLGYENVDIRDGGHEDLDILAKMSWANAGV